MPSTHHLGLSMHSFGAAMMWPPHASPFLRTFAKGHHTLLWNPLHLQILTLLLKMMMLLTELRHVQTRCHEYVATFWQKTPHRSSETDLGIDDKTEDQ